MSLNHICLNGKVDLDLDVKSLSIQGQNVNPGNPFDQDLNTTSDVRFNKISVTSTMFTDPDQVVSKQYVDNSAPGLGSLQSAYDGGNTILTAPGFPVELTGTEGVNLNSNPITTGKLTFPNSQELVSRQYVDDAIASIPPSATSLQDAYDGGNTIITTLPVDIQGDLNSTVINTPELTIQNCTITNPTNDLLIDCDGGNGLMTLNASIVRNGGQLACVGVSGTGIIMNNQEIVTNKTIFTNDQELVSKKYVDSKASGFSPFPISMADVSIPTQTSQFYYQTFSTTSFNLATMTTFNNGASVGDVFLAVYRGTLLDRINAVCIAKATINTATNPSIATATLTIQSGQTGIISNNEPLIVGMYMSTTSVDMLGANQGLSNNINSGFNTSNLATEMPDAIPFLTGTGSGNYKFCCSLST
jgi:hypothetical protein